MNLQVKRTLRGMIGIVRHGPGGKDDTIIYVTQSSPSLQPYLLLYTINPSRPHHSDKLQKAPFCNILSYHSKVRLALTVV